MIKGLALIFLFYWLGEAVSVLLNGFMPGSILGMLALFTCLKLKWIRPDPVREPAKIMAGNMAVFLIPSAVGIMLYGQQLLQAIVPIAVSVLVSTTLTILTVALTQQFFETRAKRNPSA